MTIEYKEGEDTNTVLSMNGTSLTGSPDEDSANPAEGENAGAAQEQ